MIRESGLTIIEIEVELEVRIAVGQSESESACLIATIKVSWVQRRRLVSKRGRNSFKGAMYFYGAHESVLVPVRISRVQKG